MGKTKCDRCGKEEVGTSQIAVNKGIKWELDLEDDVIELCPECEESFNEWFEEVKNDC